MKTMPVSTQADPRSSRSASCCSRCRFATLTVSSSSATTRKPLSVLGSEVSRVRIPKAALKRAAKATVNASPEPVTKGKAIAVTGKLTRANWSTKKYDAYSGRTVSLQFRAKGADAFKTVKKATTSSTGGLRTTVTASVDGSYRWVYYGNSTTGVATSAADYVDVR